jgi:FecR protein
MHMTIGRLQLAKTLAIGAVLASTFLVVSASAESKARIVRLSDVEGTVQIDRAAGEGFEKAFLNLPMMEGSRLKTGKDGRVEIEFEDGSALRLGPDSELAFSHLALGDDGQKLSTVQLVTGTAYANLNEKKGDRFLLNFAQESITVPDAAHFRLVLSDSSSATLAVFKGKVNATGPSGRFEVAEKHSATIDLAAAASNDQTKKDAFVIAKNYEQESLDGWDRQQNDYRDRYTARAGGSGFSSPYGYGVSDLNYYGSFMTVPGYGFAWQPYFAGAGWNPFMDGAFAWYPGAGYMWVSAYPWGWMPYRYGNWAFAPGFGWVWQPGLWNSWYAIPQVVNAPAGMKIAAAPLSGHKTVMVGMGLTANPIGAPHKVTINPGSAGLGVPRGSVRHLDHLAQTMERTSRPVVVATAPPPPPPSGNSGFGTGSSGIPGGTPAPSHPAPAPRPRPH